MTAIIGWKRGWTKNEAVEEMKAFGFAGRYHRLFNYVQDYSPHPTLSTAVADEQQ